QLDYGQSLWDEEEQGGNQPHQQRPGAELRRRPEMPETEDGDQIEQDQIPQLKRADKVRGLLCRLRRHKRRIGINKRRALCANSIRVFACRVGRSGRCSGVRRGERLYNGVAKLARSFSFFDSQSSCSRRISDASCFSKASTSSTFLAICAFVICSLRKSS